MDIAKKHMEKNMEVKWILGLCGGLQGLGFTSRIPSRAP